MTPDELDALLPDFPKSMGVKLTRGTPDLVEGTEPAGVLRGDLAAASRLSGVMSVEEEVAGETAGLLPGKTRKA